MIEPTETESKETLDKFIRAMKDIAKLAETEPEIFHDSPRMPVVSRLDEITAARNPKLKWEPEGLGSKATWKATLVPLVNRKNRDLFFVRSSFP